MREGKIILFVGVLFSLVSLREGRTVSEIKIKTACIPFSGCDFCSMSATLVTPTPDVECTTPVLDNPSQNDFDTCDENSFSGPVLGECENFQVPASDIGWQVVLHHTGGGGETISTSSWTTTPS